METGFSFFFMGTVFAAGILSFFSPCVFPLLPVYIGKLMDQPGSVVFTYRDSKIYIYPILKTLAFIAGLSISSFHVLYPRNDCYFSRFAPNGNHQYPFFAAGKENGFSRKRKKRIGRGFYFRFDIQFCLDALCGTRTRLGSGDSGFRRGFCLVRRISHAGLHGGNGHTVSFIGGRLVLFYEIFRVFEKAHAFFEESGRFFDFIDGISPYVGTDESFCGVFRISRRRMEWE